MIRKIAPVVKYAVIRKLQAKKPEYWDYATLLELAVIESDKRKAKEQLRKSLSCTIEGDWMFDTTINNLELINDYRKKRNENTSVSEKMISLLKSQKKDKE